MAKKEKGEEAYKGTISSIILSLFVSFLFLVPVFTANAVDKVRKGDGKYNFQDAICYDIDGLEDFEDDPDIEAYGEGALGYMYADNGGDIILTEITILDYPLNGTVDEYGVGITGDNGEVDCSIILIFLTMTKDDVVDLDVTRIDIFINVTSLDPEDDCEFEVFMAKRHVNNKFLGEYHVFPGGGIDKQDISKEKISNDNNLRLSNVHLNFYQKYLVLDLYNLRNDKSH